MEHPVEILVADDEPTARLLMAAALQKAGFTVRVAVDGEDALQQFRTHPSDMVMLDVEMPGLNGYQLCEILRREVGDELPIVMVTAMDDTGSIEKAYEYGATDFISKPINWPLIGHRVKYLLRAYQASRELYAANSRNAALLRAIPDLLFEVDLNGRYISCHSPRADLLVAPCDRMIGRTVNEMLPTEAAGVWMSALQEANETGVSTGRQFELMLAPGVFWFELSVSRKVAESSRTPIFVVLARNITERKAAEQKIYELAFFDSLTRLPNRQSFLERLAREIRIAQREDRKLAVLFMDLDGFKGVNDTMGHNAGDLILQWAADRLRNSIRPADIPSRVDGEPTQVELARLGGDEFTAVISNITHEEDALRVAHRIRAQMRNPFMVDGSEVVLTASIGIAIFPEDGADAATLLKHADTAMYHAKSSGRDNCQFYSSALTERAQQRLNLENNLRQALERDEFSLVYQPQIDIASGRILSVEALIRWNHPVEGVISPMDFIPLAEENGLIVPIGEWVLRTACKDAVSWQQAGHDLSVAVNLSPVQLRDPAVVHTVLDILQQTRLPPERLEIEVTEGALMEERSAAHATLEALNTKGVQIALDDFGTGYSSMSYLKRMPLNNLKVDQSFVQGLPHDRENLAIVRAILSLAKNLGFRVTAEGVETLEQARSLSDMACDALQGYYFSKPVSADAIPGLLHQRWLTDAVKRSDVERSPALARPY